MLQTSTDTAVLILAHVAMLQRAQKRRPPQQRRGTRTWSSIKPGVCSFDGAGCTADAVEHVTTRFPVLESGREAGPLLLGKDCWEAAFSLAPITDGLDAIKRPL